MTKRQTLAGAALDVVPKVAGVGHHGGDGHGGVQYRAAAQCQDEIAAVLLGEGRALHDGALEGVLHNLGKLGPLHARLLKLGRHLVVGAAYLGGFAAGHQQQCLFAGELLLAKPGDGAASKDEVGGIVKIKVHHDSFLHMLFFFQFVNKVVQTVDLLFSLVNRVQQSPPVAGEDT